MEHGCATARQGLTSREFSAHGITTLAQAAAHSPKELLALHGVGPKAIAATLCEALAAKGLGYRAP